MAAQNPNIKFIFGIILIFCGWVICFDLFLLIFGIPFFLIGTILVLFSKKSILVKISTVGLPIILWVVGFQLILHQISKKTPVTILVPENFSGQARVVYGEKGGIVPPNENGRMVLNIPANGNLIIQPYLQAGLTDMEFYTIDSRGKRNKIKEVKERHLSVNYKTAMYQGVYSGEPPQELNSDTTATLGYLYESFFVFSPIVDHPASAATVPDPSSFVEESKNNPMTDSLVRVSRKIK